LGDSWRRATDEMQMFFVPSGTFWMGSRLNTPNANTDEYPQHEVALTAFWMDYTEVTAAQFSLFLNEVGNQKERGITWINLENSNTSIMEDGGDFFPKPGMDSKPVALVSWYGAEAYCQWAGGQLPTEAQWEFAARGANSSSYPWGSLPPTCSLAQFRVCPNGVQSVGSKSPGGDSWMGAADMGGNVWEWTADWYGAYETAVSVNPTGPRSGSEKVLRGGSWGSDSWMARTASRNDTVPTFRSVFSGFRCSTPHGFENGSE
jgi:serine/threonine-protein kinase